jgi:hypothetical protein
MQAVKWSAFLLAAALVAPLSFAQSKAETANEVYAISTAETVGKQMTALAAKSGWKLIWDAPDFSVEHPVEVSSDLFRAMETLIESANQQGTRLKVVFYRGNKIARVTEN